MNPKIESLIGQPVGSLLDREPYSGWSPKRSVSRDIAKELAVHYEFRGHGFELRCDPQENIATIFIDFKKGYDPALGTPFDILPTTTRDEVRALPGEPSKGSEAPPWDRFTMDGYTIHFQYTPAEAGQREGIAMITLMRPDRVPA